MNKTELKELLKDAIDEPVIYKKGEKFELFFENFMSQQEGFKFIRKHARSDVGEIDYFYRSRICGHPLWEKCPYIYVECKNWKEHISSEKMNHFIRLVGSKSLLPFCGVYITTSYFSKHAMEALKDALKSDKILVIPIDKNDFDELINNGMKKLMENKCDFLMSRI